MDIWHKSYFRYGNYRAIAECIVGSRYLGDIEQIRAVETTMETYMARDVANGEYPANTPRINKYCGEELLKKHMQSMEAAAEGERWCYIQSTTINE